MKNIENKSQKNIIVESKIYKITGYTKKQAAKYGLTVKNSTRKNKKIDIFDKTGKRLASVGALGYNDYPTFMAMSPRKTGLSKKQILDNANNHRRLYKIRHQKDRLIHGTNGWYADNLLW